MNLIEGATYVSFRGTQSAGWGVSAPGLYRTALNCTCPQIGILFECSFGIRHSVFSTASRGIEGPQTYDVRGGAAAILGPAGTGHWAACQWDALQCASDRDRDATNHETRTTHRDAHQNANANATTPPHQMYTATPHLISFCLIQFNSSYLIPSSSFHLARVCVLRLPWQTTHDRRP